MRRLFSLDGPFPPILVPLVGLMLALAAARGPAVAAPGKTHSFIIPASEGYGIVNCFESGAKCGPVVADSWCSAHGYGKATAWGRTDDMTASLGTVTKRPAKGSLIITCGE